MAKIVVIMRQVLDLIEPVEISTTGTSLELDDATFAVNESDDHALEQALLIRERIGEVDISVVGLDSSGLAETMYAALAKGANRAIRITNAGPEGLTPRRAAGAFGGVIDTLRPDLILVGSYAHDEYCGVLGAELASRLQLPYVGVVRGVTPRDDRQSVEIRKEFPGAVMAQMTVKLPAVLGIVGAEQPPRYVPVSRVRAVMKTATIEDAAVDELGDQRLVTVKQFRAMAAARHADMLAGSDEEIVHGLMQILRERGVIQ